MHRSATLLLVLPTAVLAQPAEDDLCQIVTELNTVFFGFESAAPDAEWGPEWNSRLDENLGILRRCPDIGVLINGYADDIEANQYAFSRFRAEAVRRYYREAGIAAERLAVQALGEHPTAHHVEDPGPGDASARRVDSVPLSLTELRTAGLEPFPADPEPQTEWVRSASDLYVHVTFDWAPFSHASAAGCPELRDAPPELALQAASLLVRSGWDEEAQPLPLDPACLSADRPGGVLYARRFAALAPDLYAIEGRLGFGDAAHPAGWLVGPSGSRQTGGTFCARYETAWATADRLLAELALFRADPPSEERGTARMLATERALDEALAELAPLLEAVRAVGGEVDGIWLDCTPLPRFDPHDH